jgi:tetratricopeptide (TPR) repeat protein
VLEANNAGLVPFLTLAALSERDAAHYERAAELLKRARVLVENNGKADPRQLMQVWKYLGTVYRAAGRFDEAEEAYQKLESLSEANFGADKLDTANALTNVGGVLCDRKFYAQARPYLVRALEIYGRIHDEDSPSFVAALQMLSTAELYLGQANSAEQRVLLAIEILNRQKRSGELLAIAYNNLGQVYATEGRNKEAERAILRAKEIWIAIDGPGSPKAATALSNLGALYVRQGKYKKGEALYSESAAIDAKNFGTASIDYARDLNRLGVLYNSRKRFAESEDVLRKALEIDSKKLGDNSPILAEPYLNLGSSLQGQRRREEALECYKRGVDIMTKAGQRDAPNMASILEGYSALLREMEQWSDAEKISTEALGIRVREKIKGETYR